MKCIGIENAPLFFRRVTQNGRQINGGFKNNARFHPVQKLQSFKANRLISFAFQVKGLTADHPGRSGCSGKDSDALAQLICIKPGLACHEFKGKSQKPVSGQSCQARPIYDVIRRFAPSQVVIIHAGQVVVD